MLLPHVDLNQRRAVAFMEMGREHHEERAVSNFYLWSREGASPEQATERKQDLILLLL